MADTAIVHTATVAVPITPTLRHRRLSLLRATGMRGLTTEVGVAGNFKSRSLTGHPGARGRPGAPGRLLPAGVKERLVWVRCDPRRGRTLRSGSCRPYSRHRIALISSLGTVPTHGRFRSGYRAGAPAGP